MERTTVRKHGRGHGPRKPVNEMALDSRTGEEQEILDQRVTDGVASGQDHPPLHHSERISLVRNRMREICASGSVGGEGGNALVYPATLPAMLRERRKRLQPRGRSTDAPERGGLLRSSVEAGVMPVERRGQVIAIGSGQPATGRTR